MRIYPSAAAWRLYDDYQIVDIFGSTVLHWLLSRVPFLLLFEGCLNGNMTMADGVIKPMTEHWRVKVTEIEKNV